MNIGIGIHRRAIGGRGEDFFSSLHKAIDKAQQAFPQIEFAIVADSSYRSFLNQNIMASQRCVFVEAPDYAALQAALFAGNRQAGFFVADYGLLHFRCIENMITMFLTQNEKVLLEAKAVPIESPRYYDPRTLQTAWCSKDRLFISRSVFEIVGTFDRTLAGMFDDIDYSWRAQIAKIQTLTHPGAWYHCAPASKTLSDSELQAVSDGRQRLLKKWPDRKATIDGWFSNTRWDANHYWLGGSKW